MALAAASDVIMSHPAWGARIEMAEVVTEKEFDMSHPAWGARIEMLLCDTFAPSAYVAPRMGCAD